MANNQKEEAWKLIQKAARMNGVCQSKDLEMLRVSVQPYSLRLIFGMLMLVVEFHIVHALPNILICFSIVVYSKCVH